MYIRKAICPIPVILYALLALASRDSSCFGELNYSDSAMLLLICLSAMYHEELKQVEIMELQLRESCYQSELGFPLKQSRSILYVCRCYGYMNT